MFRQKFLSNQVAQTKLWRENKYRKKWGEIITKKKLQRNLHEKSQKNNFRPNKFWRETSSKKYLKKRVLPRSFRREITAKKYVTKFSAKKSLKRHSLPKVWKEESPRKKNQNIFGKISLTISLPRTLWREIYAKQFSAVIPTEKVLDESFLPQTPWREIFTKQFSKETPTKKYFGKKSTKQIFTEKSLPKPCPMISLLQTICK